MNKTYDKLYNDLINYEPLNEQEKVDRDQFLWLLDNYINFCWCRWQH